MLRVPDRSADTLIPIIHKHIRPGTRIISDEWKAYFQLKNQGVENPTICHKYNFVSPNDPEVHTQSIENLWRYAKDIYPERSTSEALKESYLHEFSYGKGCGDNITYQILYNLNKTIHFANIS